MFVGREKEKEELSRAFRERESRFVAVYGRRRVGKTCLIREVFKDKLAFYHSGLSRAKTSAQLKEFSLSLVRYGGSRTVPKDWFEAFDQLALLIESSKKRKKVIFIDEMPWLDTARSNFISALEHFWNSWASARNDILLIACGSATSWIIKKLLKNKGGLHNRVSYRIHVHPFSLYECELLAKQLKLNMSRMQIAETFMVFGGIPYYWSLLDAKRSFAQNIDHLIFNEDGQLAYEYDELYASLYSHPDKHISIIEALGKNKGGMTRLEIVKATGVADNGNLSLTLEELVKCGFIRKYCHLSRNTKDALYQLIDNYTLFYLNFRKELPMPSEAYWTYILNTPSYNTWKGLAFENLCLLHIDQIKQALGIAGMSATAHSWRAPATTDKEGAQIDLLINRKDGRLNICEMKYSAQKHSISADDYDNLLNKRERLTEVTRPNQSISIAMVTANGLKQNAYTDIISNSITLNHLFLPKFSQNPI